MYEIGSNKRIHNRRKVNEEEEYKIQFIEQGEDIAKSLEAAKHYLRNL